MRKKIYSLLFLLISFAFILSACSNSQEKKSCESGICLELHLSEPIEIAKPISVLITLESVEDIKSGIKVSLWYSDTHIQTLGESQWTVDLQPNNALQLSTIIQIPDTGHIIIYAGALDDRGRMIENSISIQMTANGGTLNPSKNLTPGPVPASRSTKTR